MIIKKVSEEPKKKTQKLRDLNLRRIRYELRTLMHLEYKKRRKDFYRRLGDIRGDVSLSYVEKRDSEKELLKEKERLWLSYHRHPICCWLCGNHMEDLIQDPDSLFWFCADCYNTDRY